MAKKQIYYTEAERLYVVEQMTFSEIASRLNLAEKTIRNWKQEGDWETKRLEYLKEKRQFHEELYHFARKLAKSIENDMDTGKKIDPGRMYAFTRLLPLIYRVKEYEDVVNKAEDKENIDIKSILKEALGEAFGES